MGSGEGRDKPPLKVSSKNLQEDLQALCQWERVSGKPGEIKAGEYIEGVLKAGGIPYEVFEFPAFVSYPIVARVQFDPPLEPTPRFITHSFAATAKATRGPVVLAKGSPAKLAGMDLAGRIIATEGMALPWTVQALERAGAAGIIFLCDNPVPHEMCLSPVWGTPTAEQIAELPRTPVVSTDREGSRIILGLLASGKAVEATLTTEVWTGWATLKLPVATIRGPVASEEFILVGTHYDSWYVGATDTATSDALLLEMVRLLWRTKDKLQRSVRIAWWPGHSQGRYAGSAWYADRFHRDLDRWGIAYLNLDGPGSRLVDHFALAHTAELEDFNRRTVKEFIGMAVEELGEEEMEGIKGRPGRNADQSFLGIGLASWAAYGEMPADNTDRGRYAAASGGGWYWHTPADTLDKVDLDLLAKETYLFSAQVFCLANAKVLPFAMKHTAEDFLLVLHSFREAAGDYLDFEPARVQARRLRENCGNLEIHKRAVESKGDKWKAAALNEALRRLTRVLNPILYTRGGPHHPDPALPTSLLPGLALALGLKAFDQGTREALLVGLRRELNRVEEGLARASDIVEAHLREEMEED